jgi:hypothetical protein
MPTYLTEWHFQGTTGSKWKEQWWGVADTVKAATAYREATINSRLKLLSRFCRLNRISATNKYGETYEHATRPISLQGTADNDTPQSGPEIPQSAVLIQTLTEKKSRRRWWLRGVPDHFIDGPTRGGVIAAFTGLMRTFVQNLVLDDVVHVRRRAAAGDPDGPAAKIFPVSVAAHPGVATWTDLTFDVGTPLPAVGSNVILDRFPRKLLPGINGIYRVLAVAAPVLTIDYVCPRAAPGPPQPGYVRPLIFAADEVLDFESSVVVEVYARDTFTLDGGRGRAPSSKLRRKV